jgi:hypothetical protein
MNNLKSHFSDVLNAVLNPSSSAATSMANPVQCWVAFQAMHTAEQTRESWNPQTDHERELVLGEMEEVLRSPHFVSSKRYPAFLRYIVEKQLGGEGSLLKERTLGVEVFHRSPDYDTNNDTVVRVAAGEVRKRLSLFYLESEAHHAIQISMPGGSYAPEFLRLPEGSSNGAHAIGQDEAHFLAVASPAGRKPRQVWWRIGAIILIAGALTLGAWLVIRGRGSEQHDVMTKFWQPLSASGNPVLVCPGAVVFSPTRPSGVRAATKDDDYPFVSTETATATADLTGLLGERHLKFSILLPSDVDMANLRTHSVLLIGTYTNKWTLELANNLRFRFTQPPTQEIFDATNPAIHWERSGPPPYIGSDDYGLVARYRDPLTGNAVVMIAGLGRNGLEAAAEFVTSPRYLETLDHALPHGWEKMNVEFVLKSKVIEDQSTAPSIQATYVW